MSRELTNKIIVITGASSGIGAATARACANAGMDVVITARRGDRLAEVAQQVETAGRTAEVVVGDVVDPALPARLLDAAERRFGGFYAVFANAGFGLNLPMHEFPMAELRRIFEVNFFAGFALIQEAARRLIAVGRPGHLFMCSSAVAKFSMPNFGGYSSTKAAQNHVCRAMRMELRPRKIEVSSVHPITTRTEFFGNAAELAGRPAVQGSGFRRLPDWFLQNPEDVARAVVRCLRRPRPEVWTHIPTRVMAGLMTIFPRLMDATAHFRPTH